MNQNKEIEYDADEIKIYLNEQKKYENMKYWFDLILFLAVFTPFIIDKWLQSWKFSYVYDFMIYFGFIACLYEIFILRPPKMRLVEKKTN